MNKEQAIKYSIYKRLLWGNTDAPDGMYEYFFDMLFEGNNEYLRWYERDNYFNIPCNTCDPADDVEYDDHNIKLGWWMDHCEEYYRWLQHTNFYKTTKEMSVMGNLLYKIDYHTAL